jgi:uncharacterized protein
MARVYLDASVILPLFIEDAFSSAAKDLILSSGDDHIISDWAILEVTSIIRKSARAGVITEIEATALLLHFDHWTTTSTQPIRVEPADFKTANNLVRRGDMVVRAADALHLALAVRSGSKLATFDKGMSKAATVIGLALVS